MENDVIEGVPVICPSLLSSTVRRYVNRSFREFGGILKRGIILYPA